MGEHNLAHIYFYLLLKVDVWGALAEVRVGMLGKEACVSVCVLVMVGG